MRSILSIYFCADPKDYPIIELETYRAIRTRQRFARTWCLKIDFDFLVDEEELVFYFGPSSKMAGELNSTLNLLIGVQH